MQFGVTLDTVPKINNELEEQVIGKFIVNFGETLESVSIIYKHRDPNFIVNFHQLFYQFYHQFYH